MEVACNLWLPAATQPSTGWPVVMCGTPANANKNACSPLVSVFASHGFAVISWNNMGHGYGARTTTTVTYTDGRTVTVATPGSGYDADGVDGPAILAILLEPIKRELGSSDTETGLLTGFILWCLRACQCSDRTSGRPANTNNLACK